MEKNYDVVIIGGGIIGSSVAAHLANENLKILVINTNKFGLPASFAAAGMLTPYHHSEISNPNLLDFSIKSLNYFDFFHKIIKDSTNIDFGYRRNGSLFLILSNADIVRKESELKKFFKFNADVSFLNKPETLKLEPSVTSNIVGSYYFPNEGCINNPKFLKGIIQYIENKKIEILNDEVIDIHIKSGEVESVVLSNNKKIVASKYVLCNGVWANKLSCLEVPLIKAIKGEIIELEVDENIAPTFEKNLFSKDGYLVSRKPTNKFERTKVIIGSTSEEMNIQNDKNVFENSVLNVKKLLENSCEMVPDLSNAIFSACWAGLRPKTLDEMPIIGEHPEIRNLIFGLGHYRNGILMAPFTGKIISEIILCKKHSHDISNFKIDRFIGQKTTV